MREIGRGERWWKSPLPSTQVSYVNEALSHSQPPKSSATDFIF
jgi:hypothetical protein